MTTPVQLPDDVTRALLWLQREAERLGYRFERSPDGTEERMIRPDGSVAVYARKRVRDGA
jgi:hypothetical protein